MDEPTPAAPVKKRRRRRRVQTGSNQYRAYEVRIGRQRIYADGAEVSHGCLHYWVDNSMISQPIKRKVEIISRKPVGLPARRSDMTPADLAYEQALEAERQRRNKQHEDDINRELEASMGDLG